jgi:hypothetical protein
VPEPGAGVDSAGNPVLDPTKNVLDLVDAAMRRQDDLREMESAHIREILTIRGEFMEQLRRAEAARLDSIRAVDQSAVQRAAEVQATQASALAAQVVATADAFRVSLAAALEPIVKDIADLRKTQYEQAGQKSQVTERRLSSASVLGWIVAGVSFLGFIVILANVLTNK